jgi:lipoyl-dependent peroxiredoxin
MKELQFGPIFKPPPRVYLCLMKTIHVAEVIAQGGRSGTVETPEGGLDVKLSQEENGARVTPEHLFGGAYASCFLEALTSAIEKSHLTVEGATVVAKVHLDEDERGDYRLNVDLKASLPGLRASDAQHVMNLAHQTCPYSKATRGNINVTLSFD